MDLRVLRYFLAICQEKNISKAAQQLHLSQPSLSKQIKDLEAELGVTLFIRGRRQIKLTEDGYYLRDRAQEMITLADNTIASIKNDQVISGKLTIGAGQTESINNIMPILNQLVINYPQIQINFIDGNADQIEAGVNSGAIDFGFITGDRPIEEFETLLLPRRNQFGILCSKNNPLAKKEAIKPKDLIAYPLFLSRQTFAHDKMRKWFGQYFNQIRIAGNYNLEYSLSLLLSQSKAVAAIAYQDISYLQGSGQVVWRPLIPELSDPNILIWKKNIHRSNLDKLFLKQVQNMFTK